MLDFNTEQVHFQVIFVYLRRHCVVLWHMSLWIGLLYYYFNSGRKAQLRTTTFGQSSVLTILYITLNFSCLLHSELVIKCNWLFIFQMWWIYILIYASEILTHLFTVNRQFRYIVWYFIVLGVYQHKRKRSFTTKPFPPKCFIYKSQS